MSSDTLHRVVPAVSELGDFELDVGTRTITGPDGSVHVEPQVFDVLTYLATHRDRVVPKTELLDEMRSRLRNVSRLMDRVGCGRCRLWGKLQVQGLGEP